MARTGTMHCGPASTCTISTNERRSDPTETTVSGQAAQAGSRWPFLGRTNSQEPTVLEAVKAISRTDPATTGRYFFGVFRLIFAGLLRLPNGFGTALLGTDRMCFTASRNRVNASGPSIISGLLAFIVSSCHYSFSRVASFCMKARTLVRNPMPHCCRTSRVRAQCSCAMRLSELRSGWPLERKTLVVLYSPALLSRLGPCACPEFNL